VRPVEDILANHLEADEKLIWSGAPKQGVRLQASDAFTIPFSIFWAGFAFFWEAGVLGLVHLGSANHRQTAPPAFMAIWGIPFCLIGLYMLVGRFFYDAALRKKTLYAVTDRRLIVLKNLGTFNLTSFDLRSTTNINLTERADGSGDILFGATTPVTMFNSGSNRRVQIPGFYLLPNAREIFWLIRNEQAADGH
jgi:hypothetical protein